MTSMSQDSCKGIIASKRIVDGDKFLIFFKAVLKNLISKGDEQIRVWIECDNWTI